MRCCRPGTLNTMSSAIPVVHGPLTIGRGRGVTESKWHDLELEEARSVTESKWHDLELEEAGVLPSSVLHHRTTRPASNHWSNPVC